MKATVNLKEFEQALRLVGRAVPKKAAMPVLTRFLLRTDGNFLSVAGTNLEIVLETSISARVEREGAICLPSSLLTDYVKSRSEEELLIDFDETQKGSGSLDGLKARVSAGRSRSNINVTPAREFPPLPEIKKATARFTVEKAVLNRLISQVAFAAAREESRPVLTGCELAVNGSDFSLAAADGFRLAASKGSLNEEIGESSVIIPRDSILELGRLLKTPGVVEVSLEQTNNGGRAIFDVDSGSVGSVRLVCQLLHGTFPNWQGLIPSSYKTRVIIDTREIQGAIKRASHFANKEINLTRLRFGSQSEGEAQGVLAIEAKAAEVGELTDEVDLIAFEGESSRIAINSRYIADGITAFGRGQLALEVVDQSSPLVFRHALVDELDDYVYVAMPMATEWAEDSA